MFTKTFSLFILAACSVIASPVAIQELDTRQTTCPTTPSTSSYNNAKLADPFTFIGGTTVKTKADWTCRAAEIKNLAQATELGTLPTTASVTATLSGTTLSITVTDGGKSISFAPTIKFPTSGTAPFPAIIAFGGASIPIPASVAVITFNNDDIGGQSNVRGQGKFYTLYGSGHSAGATTAWAWGVGRIIDAIEKIGTTSRIDPKRIGVTGCSRNGKGAFIAGALEPRVALTLPQESGSGGTNSWRVSDWINTQGKSTQTASEIVGENVWYSPLFNSFAQSSVNKLPIDHHLLAALIAPRGLLAIDQAAIDWLGAQSSWISILAAKEVYKALGAPEAHGISQSAGHDHCSFPSAQNAVVTAYINKYLLGQSSTTNVSETAGSWASSYPGTWTGWTTPTLT